MELGSSKEQSVRIDWIQVAPDRVQWWVHPPSGFINDGEFLDQLSDYQLLKKDTVPWNSFPDNFECLFTFFT
jgi:hypothetical protein